MLLPTLNNLVLTKREKKQTKVRGIVVSNQNDSLYVVNQVSLSEQEFKIGDIVVVNEQKLTKVTIGYCEYYIIAATDVLAKYQGEQDE